MIVESKVRGWAGRATAVTAAAVLMATGTTGVAAAALDQDTVAIDVVYERTNGTGQNRLVIDGFSFPSGEEPGGTFSDTCHTAPEMGCFPYTGTVDCVNVQGSVAVVSGRVEQSWDLDNEYRATFVVWDGSANGEDAVHFAGMGTGVGLTPSCTMHAYQPSVFPISGAVAVHDALGTTTLAGNDVIVRPPDQTGSTNVQFNFNSVTEAGVTTVSTSSTGPTPSSFTITGNPPLYYDLHTTALFTGAVEVCIGVPGLPYGQASKDRLYHYVNGAWQDITTRQAYALVCGLTTSLSPFATGTPTAPMPTAPEPDRQGPSITISSPLPAAVFSYGQVATVSYSCSDPSRVQECRGTLIGDGGRTNVPVADGATLDTTRPGSYLLRVLARDGGGFVTVKDVEFTVQPAPGDILQTVTGGDTVSTGTSASPEAPLQTSIQVPAGVSGTVSVDAQPLTTATPSGFELFGQQLQLEGPTATADNPYTVSFTVDESVLNGLAPSDVQVFRDGALLSGCTHRTAAVPDPCIVSRGYTADNSGDAQVTVRTSHFSTWTLGRRTQGPLASVAAAPADKQAKAGAVVPGKVAPRR